MPENMNISNEQRIKYQIEALEILNFEEQMEFHVKSHGDNKIVVYLKDVEEGYDVFFRTEQGNTHKDDSDGTLAHVKAILDDAADGTMPTQTASDMQYVKDTESLSDDDPAKITLEMLNTDTNTDVVKNTLVPLQTTTDIVRPAVSAPQAIAAWREFQDLQKAILEPSDFQKIQGKDFKKKSAWRKFAAFFNLNDKIVEETQTPHTDGLGWTWKVKVICTAPNGRSTEGVGMCSTSERNFAHVEHDTYSTAHTRAKNRAISDMVAAGEVSAEEVTT